MEHRPGSKGANGHSSSGSGAGITRGQTQPSSDIYKQLINNDMVKELDDIEAISQQIFQHAEVLHNSWKNNGMTQPRPGQFKLSTSQQGPSLDHSVSSPSPSPLSLSLHNRERGGGGFLQSNGGSGGSGNTGSLKQPSHYTRQAGYSDTPNSDSWGSNYSNYHSLPDRGHKAVHPLDSAHSPLHSQSSSVSSPTSSTRESPARGSSLTHITSDVGPLELLASPNLNGNLEDLVSSFVNTDRQKQAARNTISSTLMRRLGSPNGSASPVRSPSPTLGQQPTSPTSSLNYSPLRSPMLASSAQARQPEPLSPPANMFPSDSGNDCVHTPMQSIFSKSQSSSNNLKSSPAHHNNSHSHTLPKMSPNVSDIHTPMQSFFSHGPKASTNSNFNNFNNGANPKTSPLHINTDRDMHRGDGAIPIPVKHIPINKAPAVSSDSPASGLKSPSVLQSAKQSSVHPLAPGQGPSDQHSPMPNLFNELGHVNDAKFVEMRRRFDEAKQRMALSLPAREGGVRPNSFGSMRMFDSPWGDDPSSFLLEQFRRRNKRMMPQMPHSELTPEQKQHISDRGVTSVPSGMRRMMGSRPGGSVAERVLMFEKSPSAFGVEPVQVRVPQRREPQLSGTVITPWRASLHQEMAAPVSRQSQVSLDFNIDGENNHYLLFLCNENNFHLIMIFKLIHRNVFIIFDNQAP